MSENLDMNEAAPAVDIQQAISRPRKRTSSQFVILVLILSCSTGALYAMRRMGMQSGFQFKTVQADFEGVDADKARTYERIMADLQRIQNPLDVALKEFGRSPFMRQQEDVTIKPEGIKPIGPEMTEAEKHLAEAKDALTRMKLNTIIGNVARIDDKTVRAGDVIGMFTVTRIEGRTVYLDAYETEFSMTMETNKQGQKKSPTRMGTGSTVR